MPKSKYFFWFEQVEDPNATAQTLAAEKLKQAEASSGINPAQTKVETIPEESDEEEVSPDGIEQKDIELVMTQANVSKTKAIKALKNNDNDIVNAIMVSENNLFYNMDLIYLFSLLQELTM